MVARSKPTFTSNRRGPLAGAAVTLIVLLSASTVIAAAVRRAAIDDARDRFRQSADQTAAAVEREVAGYFDKLRDIGAFVANAPGASAERFAGYVDDTYIFEQLPSLVGVFFVHRVEESDLDAFLATTKRENPTFGVLTTIGEHQAGMPYYLLTYYVPGAVDLKLPVGTDIALIPSVTGLIEVSRSTGSAVAGSFQNDPVLRQIAESTQFETVRILYDLDFFIGMPVYEAGGPDDPSGKTIGWIGATVDQFEGVLHAASRGQPEDVGVSLTVDLTDTGMENQAVLSQVAEVNGQAGPSDKAAFELDRGFTVEGVNWRLAVWSTPDAAEPPLAVPLVFVAGVAVSLLAAGIIYLRMRARQRDRAFAAELTDREQFQRDIVDSVANAMVVLDADGTIVANNPAWADLRRHTADRDTWSDVGRGYLEVLEPRLCSGVAELEAAITSVLCGAGAGVAVEVDVAIEEHSRRRWFAVRATPLRGRRGGAVVLHTDITERKRSHDELELKASRDDLTGLLNRATFESEVTNELARARANGAHIGVLFIDLDGFKGINDTYGHAVGDEVLRTVARRITGAVRSSDRVGRLGGDEFVVLIAPLANPSVAETTAARILAALDEPVRVSDLALQITASIGIAAEEALLSDSPERIIRLADEAMYRSKSGGGGRATAAR